MRRYEEPVEVRRGLVAGAEAPAQFVWHGHLWTVCEVLASWMETGPWWEQAPARSVLGVDCAGPEASRRHAAAENGAAGRDLLAEREMWRVDAARGCADYRAGAAAGRRGVFDLGFDWAAGQWLLVRALD